MSKPTPQQIAQALYDFLYEDQDEELKAGQGVMLLTNYDRFSEIHQRDRVNDSLYTQVYEAGLELGILIGFGGDLVFVGTDDNFGAALRWQYKP